MRADNRSARCLTWTAVVADAPIAKIELGMLSQHFSGWCADQGRHSSRRKWGPGAYRQRRTSLPVSERSWMIGHTTIIHSSSSSCTVRILSFSNQYDILPPISVICWGLKAAIQSDGSTWPWRVIACCISESLSIIAPPGPCLRLNRSVIHTLASTVRLLMT